MKYKAILFDMDGTILDTLEDLADAVNYVLSTNNEPERTLSEIRSFVGNGNRRLMARALRQGEEHPGFERMLNEFFSYYMDHGAEKTKPYEGIPELLKECKRQGIKTAVVTNKFQDAAASLSELYFADLIETTVGDGEGRQRKPAKDGAAEALKRLGAAANEAVYIGDSPVDFETAKNAGIDCVLCTWGFCDRAVLEGLGAMALVDKPSEMLDIII